MCITFTSFKTYLENFLEFIPVTAFEADPVSNTTLPLKLIIIHSKYFPDSDWLKAHV